LRRCTERCTLTEVSELLESATSERFESATAETGRIIRTATVWTAAAVVAPAVALGPLLASGWRPAQLVLPAALAWWIGAVAAGIGVALLIWAACPVLGFPLEQAHPQKIFSIRVGVVLNVGGMALAGLAILLSPL
jgi:hypothetical protein